MVLQPLRVADYRNCRLLFLGTEACSISCACRVRKFLGALTVLPFGCGQILSLGTVALCHLKEVDENVLFGIVASNTICKRGLRFAWYCDLLCYLQERDETELLGIVYCSTICRKGQD